MNFQAIRRTLDRVLRPHRRHLRAESSRFNPEVITATRLWRNGPQLRLLAGDVLPRLAHELDRPVRVAVHAGSIGCEAASLRMALLDGSPSLNVEITSFDIDPAAVRRARRGEYAVEHLTDPGDPARRLMPEGMLDRFVRESPDGRVSVDPAVIGSIRFAVCDMTDPRQLAGFGAFDLVLCQNVLVHLTPEASRSAVANLARCLTERGVLALGGTPPDTLADVTRSAGLVPLSMNDRAVYDAWSGRQAIHRNAPRCHLGLEPYNEAHADADRRYGHLFTTRAAAQWWQPRAACGLAA